MATTEIKVLTQAGLTSYDEKIKAKIAADVKSAQDYADSLADNYDAAGTAETKVNALANGQVKNNTDAISALTTKVGDIPVGYTATTIADYAKELADNVAANGYDDSALKARVAANETAISTLNGTGVGSVDKKVADAVAALIADAPEAYDTLKEISDWISTHASDASAMNSQISTNKTDIASLKTLIGTLPTGTTSTTIVAYIAEAIGASESDLTSAIATAKSEAISTASTDASAKANAALTDAKAYADGLATNYATATQGAKADSAVQSVSSGLTNGTLSVDGVDVSVKGLGSAAYTASSAYDAAGAASTVQASLDTYKTSNDAAVLANTTDIDTLEEKVAALESTTYTAITEAEIAALFV